MTKHPNEIDANMVARHVSVSSNGGPTSVLIKKKDSTYHVVLSGEIWSTCYYKQIAVYTNGVKS